MIPDSSPAAATPLLGRNALITGGSQGMGRAIAEHFLAAGANVLICSREQSALVKVRDELQNRPTRVKKSSAKSAMFPPKSRSPK